MYQGSACTVVRVAYHSCAVERGVCILCIPVALLNCMHERSCSDHAQSATPSGHIQQAESSTALAPVFKLLQQGFHLWDERQHGLLPDQLCQTCPAPASDWGQRQHRGSFVRRAEKSFTAHTVTDVARAEPRARSTFVQTYSVKGPCKLIQSRGRTSKQAPQNTLSTRVNQCTQQDPHSHRRVNLPQRICCALLCSARSPLGKIRSPLLDSFSAGSVCVPAVPHSRVKASIKGLTASVNNAMHGGFYKAQVIQRPSCALRSARCGFHGTLGHMWNATLLKIYCTHTKKPRHSRAGARKGEAALQLLQYANRISEADGQFKSWGRC